MGDVCLLDTTRLWAYGYDGGTDGQKSRCRTGTWRSSWRIFWLTILHRAAPDQPVEIALTSPEIQRLDQLVEDTVKTLYAKPLTRYIIKLAQLGGYMLEPMIRLLDTP